MPPKRTPAASSVSLDSADEKFISTLLTNHINARKDGVIVRPSDPTAFPLVDAVSVASNWKLSFPTRFSRYTKQGLEAIVTKVYSNLAAQHKAENQPTPPPTTQPTATATAQPTTKRQVQVKPAVLVKKPKGNNVNKTDVENQNVQLAPLTAGMSAMSMANAVAGLSSAMDSGAGGLFSQTPFDDDFVGGGGKGQKRPAQNNNETIDNVDIDLIDSGDSDFDSDMLEMLSGDDEFDFGDDDDDDNDITMTDTPTTTTTPPPQRSRKDPLTKLPSEFGGDWE